MFNIKQKSKLSILTVLVILSIGTIMPALAFAAPLANTAEDWQYVNANSWAQNYNPQTQITSTNVDSLEVKWIFPLEGNSAAPAGLKSISVTQGTTTPPIVANGKVFVTTNFLKTYAINAKTGQQEWAYQYSIDVEEIKNRLPIAMGGLLTHHLHGFRYWESGNALLFAGLACDFYAVDADSGETSFWIKDLCANVPGNLYDYGQGTVSQTNIGTYDAGRLFVFVLPGVMHSTVLAGGDFRHTTLGIDMDTHDIVWRLFSFPPHGVLTKDWALQECDIGYFRDIPCSTVAAQAPENLEWDWAQPNQPPSTLGGVTANWGEIVVDEDTGIIYTQTGNQGPYTYIGETPGPRLYGSTIMAIDASNGQRLWWSQPMPRDPYDYDCNWGGILAEDPTLGKVYMKGCKEGRLHILDAETGEPIHLIDVTLEQYEFGQIGVEGTIEYKDGGIKYRTMDPLNNYDMREMVAPDGSPYCGDPCTIYPYFMNGIFSTDMSYDPQTNTLYHYEGALQVSNVESARPPYETGSAIIARSTPSSITNTTIVARDVTTGEVKWNWFYNAGHQRSHLVVTPDVIFAGFTDGFIRYFNPETGELLREMNIGTAMRVGMSTGQDSSGDQKIFLVTGEGSSSFAGIMPTGPGTVIAIGLNERAAQAATVTSTSRTTLTSTTTSVSTSISSTTVTSSVTEEVGMSSTITYAAVAVAIIAIIAVALIYTKKIKI